MLCDKFILHNSLAMLVRTLEALLEAYSCRGAEAHALKFKFQAK